MSKKTPWSPPDPVALRLMLKKKRREVPDATYLQIKIFQRYRTGVAINFEKLPQLNKTHYNGTEYDRWLLSKIYIPVDSELITLKGAHKTKQGTSDRVAVKLPKKFIFETDCPRLWPATVKKQLIKQILDTPANIIRSIQTIKDEKGNTEAYVHLLTEKNWDFIVGQPKKDQSTEIETKKVFDYAYF